MTTAIWEVHGPVSSRSGSHSGENDTLIVACPVVARTQETSDSALVRVTVAVVSSPWVTVASEGLTLEIVPKAGWGERARMRIPISAAANPSPGCQARRADPLLMSGLSVEARES